MIDAGAHPNLPADVLDDLRSGREDVRTFRRNYMSAGGATALGILLGGPLVAFTCAIGYMVATRDYDNESLVFFAVLSLICLGSAAAIANRVRHHRALVASIAAGDDPYGFHVSPRYFCAYLDSGPGERHASYFAAHEVVHAQLSSNHFYSENVSRKATLATMLVERDGARFYVILSNTFVEGGAAELTAALRDVLGAEWSEEVPYFDDEAREHQWFIDS